MPRFTNPFEGLNAGDPYGVSYRMADGRFFVPYVDQVGGYQVDEFGQPMLAPGQSVPQQLQVGSSGGNSRWYVANPGAGTAFDLNGQSGLVFDQLPELRNSPIQHGSFLGETLGNFMGGPGLVLGTGLGISGLVNGGFGHLFNGLGEAGGAMDMGVGGIGEAMGLGGSGGNMGWLEELLRQTGEFGVSPELLESGFNPAISNAPWWSSLPTGLQNIVQGTGLDFLDSMLGGGSGGGGRGLNANSLLSAFPIVAAIDYAKSQGPFDTSRLESLYGNFNPQAAAFSYDQNTDAGRRALESSLTSRGVMGSSFGNMDITNFNTNRELGRNALMNQTAGSMANIASSILDADVKARQLRNDLYGRSLLALGNVFGGRNQAPVFT